MKKSFNIFDKNHDGVISAKEIVSTFTDMQLPITITDAETLVAEYDEDGDGCINLSEFISLMKSYLKSDETQTSTMFDYFDHDKDGFITRDEFIESMKCLGVYLSHDEANQLLEEFYTDKDAILNRDDFIIVMKRYL